MTCNQVTWARKYARARIINDVDLFVELVTSKGDWDLME